MNELDNLFDVPFVKTGLVITAEDKFAEIKAAAAKKPIKLNPSFSYIFSEAFMAFLNSNKDYVWRGDIISLINLKDKLISATYTGRSFSVTMIDIGRNNENISYVQTDRLIKAFQDDSTYAVKSNENFDVWFTKNLKNPEFWKQNRSEMKAGRFLKSILNSMDTICEQFNDIYKSYNDSPSYEFQLVSGEDIVKYYDKATYDISNTNGGLFRSCMGWVKVNDDSYRRQGECPLQDRLQFYALNENCALLILRKKGSHLIKGRCLVWKTTNDKIYLDRVYVDIQSDFYLYKKYAVDHGYYSHVMNNRPPMVVKLNNEIKTKFQPQGFIPGVTIKIPYLDSFSYDRINNQLHRN